MFHNKKGFTLMELLVVIAVVAILVSIVIPNVLTAKRKADGAADAANLRSVLGAVNVELSNGRPMDEISVQMEQPESQVFPGAKLQVVYVKPASLYTYFVEDSQYYGMDYMVDVARAGSSERDTRKPPHVGKWYELGLGEVSAAKGETK